MYLLGHAGITLASGLLINRLVINRKQKKAEINPGTISVNSDEVVINSNENYRNNKRLLWLTGPLNPGVLLAGSMLPDIIDKPLGVFILGDTISNGRAYSHTLLFIILLSLAGWLLWRWKGKLWLLTLGFGAFMHLILDQMWLTPSTLLWPALGTALDRQDISNWVANAYAEMFTDPGIYIPEIIGLLILIWYVFMLAFNRHVLVFNRGRKKD